MQIPPRRRIEVREVVARTRTSVGDPVVRGQLRLPVDTAHPVRGPEAD